MTSDIHGEEMARQPSTSTSRRITLPQLVSLGDLANSLGVSERHVRRLVSERRIPFHKWGRLLRFDIDEVNAWITDACVEPDVDRRAS